jgi:tetratricopeptide (TPR) repeat protein
MPKVHPLRLLLLFLALCLLAGSLAAAHTLNYGQVAHAYLHQAELSRAANNEARAIHYQRLYLQKQPDAPNVLQTQAELLSTKSDRPSLDEAHILLERLLLLQPTNRTAREKLIDLTIQAGRFRDSQHHIEELLKTEKPNAKLLSQLAICRWANLELNGAEELFVSALEQDISYREAVFGLFDLGLMKRDTDLMRSALCVLESIFPEDPETVTRLFQFAQLQPQ